MSSETEREAPRWLSEGKARVAASQRGMKVGSDIHLLEMAIYAYEMLHAAHPAEPPERELLRELASLVRGECPSLLNEDSGGDARLSMAIDEALDCPQEPPRTVTTTGRRRYWVGLPEAQAREAKAQGTVTSDGAGELPELPDTRIVGYGDDGFGNTWDVEAYTQDDMHAYARAAVAQVLKGRGAELQEMKARKDAAYLERNQVVAALAKAFPSGVARTAIEGWAEDWHGCVYINLPTGQASWHFHDSQAYLFKGLPPYAGSWDGHTTEEKYRRLAAMTANGVAGLNGAARDVLAERRRQVEVEGWTPEHDDAHDDQSLSVAAACYALADFHGKRPGGLSPHYLAAFVGWGEGWFKPSSPRRNLVKACALGLAEIERFDRAASQP